MTRRTAICSLGASAVLLLLASPLGARAQTSGSAVPVDAAPATRVEIPGDTAPPTSPGSTSSPVSTPPVSTSTTSVPVTRVVEINGHGYGHGRGLGQWGAYGYAVDKGWDYRKILAHYYSNTVPGKVSPQSAIGVRLMGMEGKALTVYHEKGWLSVTAEGQAAASAVAVAATAPTPAVLTAPLPTPSTLPDGTVVNASVVIPAAPAPAARAAAPAAVRIKLIAPGVFSVADSPDCDGPFVERAPIKTTAVFVSPGPVDPAADPDDPANMLQICDKSSRRVYRGDLVAADGQPGQRAVNQVPLDVYVRGVVPAEVPRSWGSTARGMEALRAQAVAARSYAAVERRNGYSNTCDTTACQVYRGRGEYRAGAFTSFEDSRTDQAVADTANEVRVDPVTGAPVRTEFSSSTGGHSAGGVHPAVVDEGDATSANPHHSWTVRIPASKFESGRNLGALVSIDARRDGNGPDGGRVLELRLTFSKGTASMSGADLVSRFGLRSTLFSAGLVAVATAPAPAEDDDPPAADALALAAEDDTVPGGAPATTRGVKRSVRSTTTTMVVVPAKKASAKGS